MHRMTVHLGHMSCCDLTATIGVANRKAQIACGRRARPETGVDTVYREESEA